jgi:hypothetical protein
MSQRRSICGDQLTRRCRLTAFGLAALVSLKLLSSDMSLKYHRSGAAVESLLNSRAASAASSSGALHSPAAGRIMDRAV